MKKFFISIIVLIFLINVEASKAETGFIPVGSVIAYSGENESIQEGNSVWFICDGRSLKISEYLKLFKIIGWTYGYGDDQINRSTFSLPDYRGYFLRGMDKGTDRDPDKVSRRSHFNHNVIVNDKIGSFEEDSLQSHKHKDSGHKHGSNAVVGGKIRSDDADDRDVGKPDPEEAKIDTGYADLGDPVDSGTGAGKVKHGKETRPKNVSVNWIIRAK
jgi:hypothetical protein